MSDSKPKVLFILSSHGKLGDTGKPTGWWLSEFAHPYYELDPYCDITVASPAGGQAPLDPGSVEASKDDASATTFLNTKQDLWEKTNKLSSYKGKAKDFEAIFFVGGHGPMFDLATDEDSIALIKEFYEAGKIISAVCHGPAALINVKLNNGEHLLAKQAVTGFSNSEENTAGLSEKVPFLLETELNKASDGEYTKGDDWSPKVVSGRDGKLITGQNPQSAAAVGKAILHKLQEKK